MTAGAALFFIDALLVALAWPPVVWLAVDGAHTPHRWWQAAIFAGFNLLFLFALGLYRREAIADTSNALSRIPLVTGIALAVSGFVTVVFGSLRRHAIFRPRLLVVGAGKRAWDLAWILREQGRYLYYDVTFVHDDIFGPADPRLTDDPAIRVIHSAGDILQIARQLRADQIVVAP